MLGKGSTYIYIYILSGVHRRPQESARVSNGYTCKACYVKIGFGLSQYGGSDTSLIFSLSVEIRELYFAK